MSDPTTPYGGDRVPDDIQEVIARGREEHLRSASVSCRHDPSRGEMDDSDYLVLDLFSAALSGLCANPNLTGHEPIHLAARALAIAEAAADRFENDGERS